MLLMFTRRWHIIYFNRLSSEGTASNIKILIDSLVFSFCVWPSCLGPSLIVNLLHHITRLHNCGVRMTSGLCKYDHVSHYRFVIGWLPVSSVIPHHSLVAMYMQYRCNHCLLLNLLVDCLYILLCCLFLHIVCVVFNYYCAWLFLW